MDGWRAWLLEQTPLLLHEPIQNAPDWLLPILTVLVFGLLIYLCLEFVQRAVIGLRWVYRLITNPIDAGKQATTGGRVATAEDLQRAAGDRDRQMAEILAELRELRAERQAQGEAAPTDAQEEALTEEAVREVLADPGMPARAAADAMREGRVNEAFRILRSDAAAGEAETAERWRRLGALARGINTAQALEAYEAAFRIQPPDFVTCIELARLRQQAGDLAGAEQAASAAQDVAGDERENGIAISESADIAVQLGNLSAAVSRYQEAQGILQKLESSTNPETQRDLSVSHNKIGDVQVAQGNLAAALESFRASHAIFERLAAADPGNAGWQRDLSVSHDRIGDVQVAQGNLAAALENFRASLAIRERLAAADPGNAGWQRDLSVSHNKIGDVQVAQGDLEAALESFRADLAIAERLSAADPGNAGWQRDLIASYTKLAETQPGAGWWAKGLAVAEALAAEGRLAPRDAWIPDYLREKAAAEAAE